MYLKFCVCIRLLSRNNLLHNGIKSKGIWLHKFMANASQLKYCSQWRQGEKIQEYLVTLNEPKSDFRLKQLFCTLSKPLWLSYYGLVRVVTWFGLYRQKFIEKYKILFQILFSITLACLRHKCERSALGFETARSMWCLLAHLNCKIWGKNGEDEPKGNIG